MGSSYLVLFLEVWPLLVVAFVIALAQGWRGVLHSYRHRNVTETAINIILSSAAMALIAVGVAWVLPLVPVIGADISNDAAAMSGVVIMVSAVGMKGLDAFMRKYAGLSVFNPLDAEHRREFYDKMTPEQRVAHIAKCPFFRECTHCAGRCMAGEDDEKEAKAKAKS